VSQSSPECALAKAPANVLGVCCVVVEAKKLSTPWFDSPPLEVVVLDVEVVVTLVVVTLLDDVLVVVMSSEVEV